MSKTGETFMVLLLAIMAFNRISCMEPQLISGNPEIQDCWKSVIETEGCVRDIFSSFIGFQVHVSPQCCQAINDISDNCFQITFPDLNLVPSLIKSFCPHEKTPPTRKS